MNYYFKFHKHIIPIAAAALFALAQPCAPSLTTELPFHLLIQRAR